MKILLVAQYYVPEDVGIGVQLHQLTTDLAARGHHVTMLTAFPNYPSRVVFEGYRGKALLRERMDGVEVIRTYIYASPRKSLRSKALNFGSFCASAIVGGLLASRPDAIYCVMPPLPLGLSVEFVALVKRAPVVVNVQDIYPDIAIELGILHNTAAIRLFQAMERLIYRQAAGVTVISEGFRSNLLAKGVRAEKIHLVPNWVDTDLIQPSPRDNLFRRQLNLGERFTLIYSGSLSYNSNVDPVVDAARLLQDEPFTFVIVGDGVRKAELESRAQSYQLSNVQFLPFQPLKTYSQVLAAADMNLVTLNTRAAVASVPSKVLKMMASGRPVLAITPSGNEVHRLVSDAGCGLCVPPDDPVRLAEALRYAALHKQELAQMGSNGRHYLELHFSREKRVTQIETILRAVARR